MILIPDYDEFNIYSSVDDIESYVEQLLSQGYEAKEEVYEMCINHFGEGFRDLIDIFFDN